MGYVIAIAGKGGTGKTTVAALLARLIKERKKGSVLAVDADPNSNLYEALGIEIDATVGSILDEVATQPDKVPAGMSKDRFLEYRIQTAIKETDGLDLLSMGKPEGPGCYCYVNNALRNVVSQLINNYAYVVVDNEAGLEHFSRRTTRSANAIVVVSDATVVGLKSAKRINELVDELGIKTKKRLLIINKYQEGQIKDMAKDLKWEYIGNIPFDENIAQISLNGNSLFELNSDSKGLSALGVMMERIL